MAKLALNQQLFDAEITDITNQGCGVCRPAEMDGRIVFVRGAVTGDVVRARLTELNKNYGIAEIEALLIPSSMRTGGCSASVPGVALCGGCEFSMLDYAAELDFKEKNLKETLRRSGFGNVPVQMLTKASDRISGYRNKAILHNSCGKFGFYKRDSREIVPLPAEGCALLPDSFHEAVRLTEEFGTDVGCIGVIDSLLLRRGSGGMMLAFLVKAPAENSDIARLRRAADALMDKLSQNKKDPLRGVILWEAADPANPLQSDKRRVLCGADSITDTLCGCEFAVSPASFFQVNNKGAELLYTTALGLLHVQDGEVMADLFCGTGTIGMIAAKEQPRIRVIGVEINPDAVADAKATADRLAIGNIEFYCGDAADVTAELNAAGKKMDAAIVDPPRKGMSKPMIDSLLAAAPQRLSYISCNPATFARDAAILVAAGYRFASPVYGVDMFPRTGHCECCALLCRENNEC